MQILRQRIYPL